ncbi:MAG: N-acetylmuramoyl-L-alanine amidase [Clostridiales bacterium]|nr:N-acetylmuramoyl-L-alanine amidase [Clostridiales bacterium]
MFYAIKKEKIVLTLLFLSLGLSIGLYSSGSSVPVLSAYTAKTVVLDAGHGGWDPGKTGTVGENEKNINLAITEKLQQYLEQGGFIVYVTRNIDEALGENKKTDMKSRRQIINDSEAELLVSIHQNAFPGGRAQGAQVFYHRESEDGKRLAQCVQKSLHQATGTNREAKENTSYYILKNTQMPAVIVECGFLSNYQEEKMLNDEQYQNKVAWAIYLGILDYLEPKK